MNPREKLIEEAYKEMHSYGYQSANTTRILKNANMNKGSMYHFFKSKKELALAVLEEKVVDSFEKKYSYIACLESDVLESIEAFLLKSEVLDFQNGCILNNLTQEMSGLDSDFKKVLQKIFLIVKDAYKMALTQAIKNKEIKECDADRVSAFIVSSYEGAIMRGKLFQDAQQYENSIKELSHYIKSL